MPVTSLRMPSARPPEVAKIKIKIKIKINSQIKTKSTGVRGLKRWASAACASGRRPHLACTVIATSRTTTGLTINTQTNATGIAN